MLMFTVLTTYGSYHNINKSRNLHLMHEVKRCPVIIQSIHNVTLSESLLVRKTLRSTGKTTTDEISIG